MKDQHVNQLNKLQFLKDSNKTKVYAEEKRTQRLALLGDFIQVNKKIREHQDDLYHQKAVKHDKERRLRGSLGRVDKFIGPQVAHMIDQSQNKVVNYI